MCNFVCVSELLGLSIFTISLPVYLLLIVLLIKKRNQSPFNGAYFRMSLALGVIDLITICHYYLFVRTFAYAYLSEMHRWRGGVLARYWTGVVLGSQRCQQLMVLAIASNRYTALLKPASHDSIWTPHYTNRVIAACVLAGYGTFLVIPLGCDIGLVPPGNSSVLLLAWPPKCRTYAFLSSSLLTFVLSVVFIILYGVMFYKIWKRHKQTAQSQGTTTNDRASRNLAVIGVVLSGLVVCNAVQFGVMVVFEQHYRNHKADHLALVTLQIVIFCMINPWLLFACSGKTRKHLAAFVGIVRNVPGNQRTNARSNTRPAPKSRQPRHRESAL